MIFGKQNFSIESLHQAKIVQGLFKSKGIDRRRHLMQAMDQSLIPGHVLEFGVYRGKTMQHISEKFRDQTCWGFDSFVGLPEPWHIRDGENSKAHLAGKFDMRLESQQPVFRDNVRLVPGWFHDSIPSWLEQNPGNIRFLHIDCDLYSSTKTVLGLLNHRIIPGTIIVFDEMYSWDDPEDYTLWAQGEFLALAEWLSKHDRLIEPLFRSRHQQCSIQVVR